jgi:BirA family biotin operon repressor/biotin-[acetyl-CoA-carboxylase] ligase
MDTPYVAVNLDTVRSTQHEARARFSAPPLLVTAERQTDGYGRGGSSWVQADRAVAASLAFRPTWASEHWPLLPLVAGLAVCTVVAGRLGLKWPNDLVVDDLKVGGLLAEAGPALVVIGLGLNLFWASPLPGTGALEAEDPGPGAGRGLAEDWAEDLLRRVSTGPDRWGREEYAARCVILGRDLVWAPGGSGRAVDVADDGGLVVETPRGRQVLRSGEVSTVRTT